MTTLALVPAETLVPMASGFPSMILLIIVVFGFMFLVQRPLRKQQAAQRELQNQVAEGSRVMLTSGMFGTITHLGDKQAIVELAPGLEVTVLRQAISKAVTADDEEFEFADDGAQGDPTGIGTTHADTFTAEGAYTGTVQGDQVTAPGQVSTTGHATNPWATQDTASGATNTDLGGASAAEARRPGEPWSGTTANPTDPSRSVAPHDENR